jgi:hypothetical protein
MEGRTNRVLAWSPLGGGRPNDSRRLQHGGNANCQLLLPIAPMIIASKPRQFIFPPANSQGIFPFLRMGPQRRARKPESFGRYFSLAAAIILEGFHCNTEILSPIRRGEHGQNIPLCVDRLLASWGQWRRATMVGWTDMAPRGYPVSAQRRLLVWYRTELRKVRAFFAFCLINSNEPCPYVRMQYEATFVLLVLSTTRDQKG